jgi:hypothetical protein
MMKFGTLWPYCKSLVGGFIMDCRVIWVKTALRAFCWVKTALRAICWVKTALRAFCWVKTALRTFCPAMTIRAQIRVPNHPKNPP